MTESATERCLRLGLQLGRHVDAYYGPPGSHRRRGSRRSTRGRSSRRRGAARRAEDGWLRDQVVVLRTYAGVLAGKSGSYADEVEGCYGVRPTYTEEARLHGGARAARGAAPRRRAAGRAV